MLCEYVLHFKEWLITEKVSFITSDEYANRLGRLGWKCHKNGSHWFCFSPDGIGKISWTENNWDVRWHQVARDLFRLAKTGRGVNAKGYPDLTFVWENPFVIPPKFDMKTQSIRQIKKADFQKIWVGEVSPEKLVGKEVSLGGGWIKVTDADYASNGKGIDMMLPDGTIKSLDFNQQLMLRVA
jgi:hypothetical protein